MPPLLRFLLALGSLLVGLAACEGFEPLDGPISGSDLKPGPGLLTGPAGELVIRGGGGAP
jgi:hypothetical protein